jgi:hypothetical protein
MNQAKIDRSEQLRCQVEQHAIFLVTIAVTGLHELNLLLEGAEAEVMSIQYVGLHQEEAASQE